MGIDTFPAYVTIYMKKKTDNTYIYSKIKNNCLF